MRPFTVSVIVVLLLAGCEDQYYQPIEPRPLTDLRGRSSMTPQWPMFHHDGRHTGNVNTPVFDVAGPQRDTINTSWRTPIGYPLFSSPAVGVDGTVYVGTKNDTSGTGSFYAINPDGTVKWRYTPVGQGQVLSSPAIGDDGSLYVGAGGGFYALTSSGQLKWKISEPGGVISSPAIGKDGTVYYVAGNFKAVDPSSGTLKWQVKGGDQFNSPAIGSDGTIFYSNEGTIRAVTPTGIINWQYKDSSYAISTVWAIEVGYDGTIYYVASTESPYLYAIDNKGNLKWKKDIAAGGGDPCLDQADNIYALSYLNQLMCIGSDGQTKWVTSLFVTDAQLNVPLTIDKNGIIYVCISDDLNHLSLEAFNKTNLLWKFAPNSSDNGGAVVAVPAIFNGSLYFAWEYGPSYLYCLH
jgi:hypothetical protein